MYLNAQPVTIMCASVAELFVNTVIRIITLAASQHKKIILITYAEIALKNSGIISIWDNYAKL